MEQTIKQLVILFTAAILTAGVAGVQAATGDAGQPGAFLSFGAGSRAMGMGGAFVGFADDATAAYWNPGGLSAVKQNQALAEYVLLVDESNYQYLGYTHLFPYVGTLGVGIVMLNQGTAEGRNINNDITDEFTNNQFAFIGGFGTDVAPQLSAGGTLKIVNQSMLGKSGTGFGLDLGLMYRPFTFMNLGLSLQNLVAPAITLVEEADVYPLNITLGIGTKFWNNKLRMGLDVTKNMDQDGVKTRLGVEGIPMHNLFVRGGYDLSELSLGAGYRYTDFQLDYAIALNLDENLQTHKVDLSYFFGGYVFEVKPEPKRFSPVGINKVSVIRLLVQTKFQIRFWKLEIYNEANTVIKDYSGEGSPPPHIVWDGMQDNANPMPDGKYKIVLTVEDVSGETRIAPEAYVIIQSVLPLGVSPIEMDAF